LSSYVMLGLVRVPPESRKAREGGITAGRARAAAISTQTYINMLFRFIYPRLFELNGQRAFCYELSDLLIIYDSQIREKGFHIQLTKISCPWSTPINFHYAALIQGL
jgi:hypothetical protein